MKEEREIGKITKEGFFAINKEKEKSARFLSFNYSKFSGFGGSVSSFSSLTFTFFLTFFFNLKSCTGIFDFNYTNA